MVELILWIYAIACLLAFCCYGIDKRKAQKGSFRIPENALLTMGLLGGGVGALLAMQLFRHKTRHWYFWAVNLVGAILQIALLLYVIYRERFGL